MRTRITELLGIENPIVQGGMHYVGYAELAAAVSNAGGLGILTALTQPTPDDLAREIERCRATTKKPFGVNLTFLPTFKEPPYNAYIDAIVAGGVRIVETAGRSPEKDLPRLKAAGDELEIPFLASGGLADGRGLVAALALGADGINMGTRFIATREAPVHENVKQAILAASERSTRLIMRPLVNTERVCDNAATREINVIEQRLGKTMTIEDVRHLVAGGQNKRVLRDGEMDAGAWSCGMVAGLIRDIPTCQELVERIMAEARAIIQGRLARFAE